MEVRILGPLEVVRDGVVLDLGPRKQRMLFADLALSAPRMVATDRLLQDLWGGDAAGMENALWTYLARLRAILEPSREHGDSATVLVTGDHGYALAIDDDDVDARRFEDAVTRGAAALRADPAEASQVLTAALAEWRGQALEEFAYEDFARPEIIRLSELRLTALEDRISADLQLGAASELVGELEALHAQHPLRERFVGQLMLAQYRAGRPADALRTFTRFRSQLADELGLDPSPELNRLEEQVLVHDDRIQPRTPARTTLDGRGAPTNPFKGLRAFGETDAPVFFGRERLVADVLRRIGRGASFVALVGPSGSGKSSIVRAGIVPALRKGGPDGTERWLVASMVPGSHPIAELEAGLLRSSLDAPDSLSDQLADPVTGVLRAALRVLPDEEARLLLVIDQFEELFALVEDDDVRTRFLDGLVDVIDDPHDRVVVAITLRSDFYERPLAHPEIGARLGDAVVNVVPLQPHELERAATEPAARSDLQLEPALLATLVGDVIGEPGALPLFQYALTELVERRNDAMLTLEGYRAIGGVQGALGTRAEDLFQELGENEQRAAQQFFLRLVAGSGGDEWSRRRVPASEIAALDADTVALQQVVERFTRHRLLTLDRDRVSGSPTVEVAHEALLTEWDRLRQWIENAREELDHHAALRAALAEWQAAGRDPDYLLTGARLRDHAAWTDHATMRLTATERDFLDRSTTASEDRATAARARAAEEERLLRAATWRLRALVGLLVLVLGGGALALAALLAPAPPRVALLNLPSEGNLLAAQLANGLDQASRDFDIRAEELVPITDSTAEIEELLATGPDLVVVNSLLASEFNVDIDGLVAAHPEITFTIIDSSALFGELPNVTTISFDSAAGSLLAGAAAAAATETGTVGFVGGPPYFIDDLRLGFEAGARSVDPDVTVLSTYLAPGFAPVFVWQGPAQAAAERLYAGGADVVFHAAGPAGRGVHEAAAERSARLGVHLWSIGVDVDEWAQVDADVREHVLTSVLKRQDLAVAAAVRAHVEGTPTDLTLGLDTGGFSLSQSGGHLDATVTDAVERTVDAHAAGAVAIPPHVAAPATDGATPDVTWTVRHDGSICGGDLPKRATTTHVGDRIAIELVNDAATPVTLDVWPLPRGTTWADVTDSGTLRDISTRQLPLSGATAAAGGRHGVAFEPARPGVWGVTCRAAADDLGVGVVGLITAEEVTNPVSATATVTFTGQACDWEGPAHMAADDVVQLVVRNESDVAVLFVGGTVLPGTRLEDLGSRPFEVFTRFRTVPPDPPPPPQRDLPGLLVAPASTSDGFLHVERPSLWAAICSTDGGDVNYPAFVVRVDG